MFFLNRSSKIAPFLQSARCPVVSQPISCCPFTRSSWAVILQEKLLLKMKKTDDERTEQKQDQMDTFKINQC